MRKRKLNILLILFVVILLFGLGYAYLTTTLSINGTTDVDSNTWNIYWDNVQVTEGSVSGSQVTTTPTIDTNKTTVSFQVRLSKPGDFYEFTVDAKNDGSIDAMIDTITKTTSIPDYLNYIVTYSNNVTIEQHQSLKSNTKEVYKVRVEYRTDINASDLPSDAASLSLSFGVTYVQADETAQDVDHRRTIYTVNLFDLNAVNGNMIALGEEMPNDITQYSSAAEALAEFRSQFNANFNFYLKHILQDEVVTESYVEFIVTPAMTTSNPEMTAGTYAIRGIHTYDSNLLDTHYCIPEYYNSNTGECLSPYYAANKTVLLSAFGSSNCTETSNKLSCYVPNMHAYVTKNGTTYVDGYGEFCSVSDDGNSSCSYVD